MDFFDQYILTKLQIDEDGSITVENEDVTVDIQQEEEDEETQDRTLR